MVDPIRYVLDSDNTIRSIEGPWDEFAWSNDGGGVLRGAVLGKPLFDFVRTAEVVQIYSKLFEAVRKSGRSVDFAFRCDGPRFRREMTMRVTPLEGGDIEIRTDLIRSVERPQVPLMGGTVSRDETMLRMCSYCNGFYVPERGWTEVEDAIALLGLFEADEVPFITHGICDECLKVQEEILDRLLASK